MPFEGLATTLDIPYGQLVAVFKRFRAMGVVISERQHVRQGQSISWALPDKGADLTSIIDMLRLEAGDALQLLCNYRKIPLIADNLGDLPADIWDRFLRGKI